MTDNFLGEIRMFGCNYAPKGWALCNGAQINLQQNIALYSLVGTTYGSGGGNPPTTFALPDLRGRCIVNQGVASNPTTTNYIMGQQLGSETVALTAAQMPAHSHLVNASSDNAGALTPSTNYLAQPNVPATAPATPTMIPLYAPLTNGVTTTALDPSTIAAAGGGAGHDNMQPFTVVNYCIAMTGLYPPRN